MLNRIFKTIIVISACVLAFSCSSTPMFYQNPDLGPDSYAYPVLGGIKTKGAVIIREENPQMYSLFSLLSDKPDTQEDPGEDVVIDYTQTPLGLSISSFFLDISTDNWIGTYTIKTEDQTKTAGTSGNISPIHNVNIAAFDFSTEGYERYVPASGTRAPFVTASYVSDSGIIYYLQYVDEVHWELMNEVDESVDLEVTYPHTFNIDRVQITDDNNLVLAEYNAVNKIFTIYDTTQDVMMADVKMLIGIYAAEQDYLERCEKGL